MDILGAPYLNQITHFPQSVPVEEEFESENESKVFSSVDEPSSAGSSHDDQFQSDSQTQSNVTDKSEADAAKTEQQQKVQNELEQKQLEFDQAEIQKLKSRDAEVRQHEAAHAATGGAHAGAPSFEYETGPDGKKYAVGGEVQISTSKVAGDPEKTLQKAAQIRAAALAPANPSSQDRRVAAQASQMAIEAQADLLELERQAAQVEAVAKEAEVTDIERDSPSDDDTVPVVQANSVVASSESGAGTTESETSNGEGDDSESVDTNGSRASSNNGNVEQRLLELDMLGEDRPAGGLLNLVV